MSKEKCCKPQYTTIGGQALIEGILMRGPKKDCIAVRMPDGSIDISVNDTDTGTKKTWKKIPIVRGIVSFFSSMIMGYKALMYSAEKSAADEDGEEISGGAMTVVGIVSLVLGLALSVVLFKFLPMLAVKGLEFVGVTITSNIVKSLIEGVIKLIIFLAYLASVSLMKDIRITFMYHGAEHKTIRCYEAGEELTPENAAKFTREHPRCGTSFLFLMVAIGILINCFLPWTNIVVRLLCSLAVLPIVMGLGYELLRLCGKYDNILTRILSAPGRWIQHLTTKEPTLEQLEIAIAAVKEVIPNDGSDRIVMK